MQQISTESIRLAMTGWARWSTGNCARNWNLTIQTNDVCTTQHLSWRVTHKLLRDFDIQTDHLISARWPDLIIINKKERTFRIVDFAVPADHRVKLKECEKRDKYLNLARELKKLWNMKVTIIPIVIGDLGTRTGGLGNNRTGEDRPNYSIVEINHNTEKSPGDLRRLAVTQTPVENHQLTLMWKTLNE